MSSSSGEPSNRIAGGNGSALELEPLGQAPGPGSTGPRMLVPLFLVPLLIVILIVGVFLGVGALVGHEETTSDLIARVETGGVNERWQAAAKLSDLALRHPDQLQDPALRARIRRAFEVYGPQEPRLRIYFANLWATIGDHEAAPMLEESVQRLQEMLKDPAARAGPTGEEATKELIHFTRALGELGDESAAPVLLAIERDPDAGIRETVAAALGGVGRAELQRGKPVPRELVAALEKLHADEDAWVRMNAALSLAKVGSAAGLPTLELMLDRDYYKTQHLRFPDDGRYTVDNYDPAVEKMRYALAAIAELQRRAGSDASLRGESLKSALEKARKDRDPGVQQAATDVLAKLGG